MTIYMQNRQLGKAQSISAAKSGISERSGRRLEKSALIVLAYLAAGITSVGLTSAALAAFFSACFLAFLAGEAVFFSALAAGAAATTGVASALTAAGAASAAKALTETAKRPTNSADNILFMVNP